MNGPALETDHTHIHLQALLYRVRKALNECPVEPQLALRSLRGWLDVCIRLEKETEEQRVSPLLPQLPLL